MVGTTNINGIDLTLPKRYLFYYGNECADITGGWSPDLCYYSGYTNNKIITIKNNYIDMCSDGTNTVPVLATINTIDLTPWKTFCVVYYCSTYTSYNYIRCGTVAGTNISSAEFNSGAGLQLATITTYAWDISSINESRHIFFMNHCAGAKSIGRIYEVYLL